MALRRALFVLLLFCAVVAGAQELTFSFEPGDEIEPPGDAGFFDAANLSNSPCQGGEPFGECRFDDFAAEGIIFVNFWATRGNNTFPAFDGEFNLRTFASAPVRIEAADAGFETVSFYLSTPDFGTLFVNGVAFSSYNDTENQLVELSATALGEPISEIRFEGGFVAYDLLAINGGGEPPNTDLQSLFSFEPDAASEPFGDRGFFDESGENLSPCDGGEMFGACIHDDFDVFGVEFVNAWAAPANNAFPATDGAFNLRTFAGPGPSLIIRPAALALPDRGIALSADSGGSTLTAPPFESASFFAQTNSTATILVNGIAFAVLRDSDPPRQFELSPDVFPDGISSIEFAGGFVSVDALELPRKHQYVALGDSFSSGEGLAPYLNGSDSEENSCHRSSGAYSVFVRPSTLQSTPFPELEESFASVYKFDLIACSGARTDNVRSDGTPPQKAPGELPQLALEDEEGPIVSADTDLVTMTIGGNDLGFVPVLTFCVFKDDCEDAIYQRSPLPLTLRAYMQQALARVRADVEETITEAAISMQAGQLYVLTYPLLLDGTVECRAGFGLPEGADSFFALDQNERTWLRSAVSDLNTGIAAAVAASVEAIGQRDDVATNISVVDAIPTAFEAHEICDPNPWISGFTPLNYEASFHPTAEGQRQYARLLQAAIGASPPQQPIESIRSDDWMVQVSGGGGTAEIGFLSVSDASFEVCPTAGVFAPGQSVRLRGGRQQPNEDVQVYVEYRDESGETPRLQIGALRAGETGDLDGIVEIPTSLPGGGVILISTEGTGPQGAGSVLVALAELKTSLGADGDLDGVPDVCDICPDVSNPNSDDLDGDGIGDACDVCPADVANDGDADGICESEDPCPLDDLNDIDADGICGEEDNCPLVANPDQLDSDNDGVGNACVSVPCFDLALRVNPPGAATLRVTSPTCPVTPSYQDGTPASVGVGESDANLIFTGWTGDRVSAEQELSFVVNEDNVLIANFCESTEDTDGDLVADACDTCTAVANGFQRDTDEDGIGNACDADLNQDCVVNFLDLGLFRAAFETNDPNADFTGDGRVNAEDLQVMRESFFSAPGPSGRDSLCGSQP